MHNVNLLEVKNAIFSMNLYKALDDFQTFFYQNQQDIVAHDVWEIVAQAFSIDNINSSLFDALIILVTPNANHTKMRGIQRLYKYETIQLRKT